MNGRDALEGLRGYRGRPEHLLVGLMTGTSADGVDAALVRIKGCGVDGPPELLAYRETPLEPRLRSEILDVASAERVEPERMMRLDAALGETYAAATLELLAAQRVAPGHVAAIGSHGQTVRHLPRGGAGGAALSLQLGSAAILAERTGIAVVSNFRARDAAAGGEGAPLVPLVDWWWFRSDAESRVLLNLGGMANLTYLPRGAEPEQVIAFDTGPGNAVSDALMRRMSQGAQVRDEGGATAARGAPDAAWLDELLADPFFAAAPPRSTGRERFGDAYAAALLERGQASGLSREDVLATCVELTAASVGLAIDRFVRPRGEVDAVFASGGGVRNEALMRALARRVAPARLDPLERLGVAPEAKEAVAFACLAHRTLAGLAGNLPSATGASHPVVLGQITPGASRF